MFHNLRVDVLVTLVDAGGLICSDQPDAIEDQLQRFDSHMVHARGLAETTRIRRLCVVRALLRFRSADDPNVMATPSADELRRFITQELSRISPASASSLAGAMRAYLRFLALGGVGVDHLRYRRYVQSDEAVKATMLSPNTG
jgi:hypothetical protein